MKELLILNSEEIDDQKSHLGLLVLDEKSITCQKLPELRQNIHDLGEEVVLMMPKGQYKKGTRGWAKAQILNAATKFRGIITASPADMEREIGTGWKSVSVPDPIVLESHRIVLLGETRNQKFEFALTNSQEDINWMERAKKMISSSNCWYYPAGCVFVREGELLIESTSLSFNNSQCKLIPLNFRELPLKKGERISFCDSNHAERVGVSMAASSGISLKEASVYVSKFPCRPCIQDMLGAGVTRVVFEEESYGLSDAQLLIDNGVEINQLREFPR